MSRHKCCPKQNPNYQIKQRYIPTYVHEQIFEQAPIRPYSSRCTPTFHSTVFDTEGYNIKTIHEKNVKQPAQISQTLHVVIQPTQKGQKTVERIQPQQIKVFHATRDKWFDHTKEEMFESIKNGQNRAYSRQRKWIDLSSDPVFTDFVYENKSFVLRSADQEPIVNIVQQNTQLDKRNDAVKSQSVNPNLNQKPFQIAVQPEKVEITESPQKARPTKIQEAQIQQGPNKTIIRVPNEKNPQKQTSQTLKVKGRNVASRPQTGQKPRLAQQKPTFTVIRKSRVHQH